MKLYIKNMVCSRCVMVVRETLTTLGISLKNVNLGEVETIHDLNTEERERIAKALTPLGFSLIDDRKSRIIEQIKTIIIDLVHNHDGQLRINLSDYLSQELNQDYNYLSHLFSQVEGNTIEKYYISQKIEKVKELLVYDELTLSEIAFRLNYSSVAHLSNQFKKVTGLTPSYFKDIKLQKRTPLDKV